MFTVTDEVTRRLIDVVGLNEAQVQNLALLALEEDLGNWTLEQFRELQGFGGTSAFGAWRTIQELKVPEVATAAPRVVLPETAPYLSDLVPYDPRDPSQFFTVVETGEMWRWDGKRTPQYPNGQRHRVIQVPHIAAANGTQIPDPAVIVEKLEEARRLEAHWYHQGYRCWVDEVGKPLGVVEVEVRQAVVQAIQAARENGYVLQTA